MLCPKCGTTVSDNTKFCPNCATQIAAQAPQYVQQLQEKSKSPVMWLVISILSFLFCCQPIGLAALICAIIAMCMSAPEQAEKAEKCAKLAKILSLVAVGCGLLLWILYFLYAIIMIIVAAANN